MTRHQYGISAVVSQTSFRVAGAPVESSGGVPKCRLFSQASIVLLVVLGFRVVPLYPADTRFHSQGLSY